jgi:histidine triad (HIT) family protein
VTDCLFCKIAKKEMKADVVTETDRFLAFRDINPQAPTHILVIPKQHISSLNDATDPTSLGDLLLLARDVARQDGLPDEGYRVVINTNAGAGQTVFHLHAHVLGGRRMKWPPG